MALQQGAFTFGRCWCSSIDIARCNKRPLPGGGGFRMAAIWESYESAPAITYFIYLSLYLSIYLYQSICLSVFFLLLWIIFPGTQGQVVETEGNCFNASQEAR